MEKLFTMRVKLSGGLLIVDAYERCFMRPNHTRIDIVARFKGKTVFDNLYIGAPGHWSIDGKETKRAVLGCLAMKPGDTDRDYFDSYSPEQLAWAEEYGEELSMIVYARYGKS